MMPLVADASDRAGHRTTAGSAVVPAVVAVAAVGVVLGIDRLLGLRGLLHEQPPVWSVPAVGRTFLIAAASALIVVAIRRWSASWATADPSTADTGLRVAAAAIGLGIAAGSAVLVLADPDLLTALTEEDGVVEWASALLAFAAAGFFGVSVRRSWPVRPGSDRRRSIAVLLSLLGFCLLVGLEEVSWFQRVLDLESPDLVGDRNQPEFNLHNEATDLSENLYYGVAFVILVLIPGTIGGRRPPPPLSFVEPLVPSRTVMYGTIAAAAVVYEMWEIVPVQMMFFVSVALVVSADRRRTGGGRTVLDLTTAGIMVAVAAVFLAFGHRMTRSWDDTEIRELLLPFGFALYGWEVMRRTSIRSRSR